MSLLPENQLKSIEAWFSDLQAELGFAGSTDRGRVLAGVRKLKEEAAAFEKEKKVVYMALGYKRWGDLYTTCLNKVKAKPTVTLTEKFYEVPAGWVLGYGKPTYGAMKRRLATTLDLAGKVWVAIDERLADQGSDWVEEQRRNLEEAFTWSDNPDDFEEDCLRFITGYEEPDPEVVWVDAADTAAAAFERASELPLAAVEELIAYAYEAGIEVTQKDFEYLKQSEYQALLWFDYLFTAITSKNNRPTRSEVEAVRVLSKKAFELWRCYKLVSANDPLRPTMTKRDYDDNVTVAMIEAACREVYRLGNEAAELTTDEWMEAVVEAVAAVNNGEALVAAD